MAGLLITLFVLFFSANSFAFDLNEFTCDGLKKTLLPMFSENQKILDDLKKHICKDSSCKKINRKAVEQIDFNLDVRLENPQTGSGYIPYGSVFDEDKVYFNNWKVTEIKFERNKFPYSCSEIYKKVTPYEVTVDAKYGDRFISVKYDIQNCKGQILDAKLPIIEARLKRLSQRDVKTVLEDYLQLLAEKSKFFLVAYPCQFVSGTPEYINDLLSVEKVLMERNKK